ncbi:helix-turn-helix domain-containing protein [Sphingomonas sp.]|uniref:helix-turn-helix transcriptional regulator n=1 Tax=Sphingomonas sp. TaxID=28214 RepID=UPI003AFFE94B
MAEVELDYVLPPADLQPYVTTFYRFRVPAPIKFDELERAQIAQVRWQLTSGRAWYHFADGREQEAPPYHLLGPTTGATRMCVEGPVFGFGMGLTPVGWAALLRSDASALADTVTDAVTLFGDGMAEAAIQLRADGGAAAMTAAVEPFVRRLLHGGDPGTLAFVRAVDDWLAGDASPVLEALVEATRLSRRQVERRCNALYGAPPKLLARKYRALRAAVQLASGSEEVEGFYDQSHMIREVKEFTGLTPRGMRTPGDLARITIEHRRALVGLVPRMVSET